MIKIFTGVMGSGKSFDLITRYQYNTRYKHEECVLFSPNREITSRGREESLDSRLFEQIDATLESYENTRRFDIFVDDFQFLSHEQLIKLIDICIHTKERNLYLYGLSHDRLDSIYPRMAEALQYADSVEVFHSACQIEGCNNNAIHHVYTGKVFDKSSERDKDHYLSVCDHCYDSLNK